MARLQAEAGIRSGQGKGLIPVLSPSAPVGLAGRPWTDQKELAKIRLGPEGGGAGGALPPARALRAPNGRALSPESARPTGLLFFCSFIRHPPAKPFK